jgi:phosphoserine aminotransferase
MSRRAHNFGAGPGALPLPVLERMRDELLDYRGSGVSILESSHRGKLYAAVHASAQERFRRLVVGGGSSAAAGDDYAVLFMGGGARTQFGLVPWNLMPAGGSADYVVTGRWSEMAAAECAKRGTAREVWSSAGTGFDRVPGRDEPLGELDPSAAFLHYTSNNTIYGTQFHHVPDLTGTGSDAPLACDMSSDVLCRPLPLERYGLIYAGAQKNLGPAGVTLVVIHRDLLERSPAELPDTLSYAKMAAKDSLLNTPPVFAVYALDLVLEWLEENGGLGVMAERNQAKAALLYGAIDGSGGFYRGHARPDGRSWMNVTFRLPGEELEQRFVAEAAEADMIGLKGHRSVGGIRASIYNAVPPESVETLVEFMTEFARVNG